MNPDVPITTDEALAHADRCERLELIRERDFYYDGWHGMLAAHLTQALASLDRANPATMAAQLIAQEYEGFREANS